MSDAATLQIRNGPNVVKDDNSGLAQSDGTQKQEYTNGIPVQSHKMTSFSLSSQAIHADDFLNTHPDVAPPLHVSTTFRYPSNPSDLIPTYGSIQNPTSHIYSRDTTPSTTRLEAILSSILHGRALTYSSGLSAFHALLTFLNPRRIAITDGYHGCHGVIRIHSKLTGLATLSLDCPASDLHPGDIVHVETPLNPTGTASHLAAFAAKAHSRGAFLTVDATFGPPPLQDPFAWGADVVMHSGTKYLGGHSDMLCGVLAVSPVREKEGWWEGLVGERVYLGNVMGSLEGWLGVRSVRTLEVRVKRQSDNVGRLVAWLDDALSSASEDSQKKMENGNGDGELVRAVVAKVEHASLQKVDLEAGWLQKQMPNGFGPVFAISMHTPMLAQRLPSKLALFHHATSLGGVESLIEWRTMTDRTVNKRLLRISIGIENWEDLRDDLLQGFKALANEIRDSI